jgi:hypothetical protein
LNQYTDDGVDELVQIYVVDAAWGLDLLIIDERHAVIAFPSVRGVKQFRLGLAFIDQPRLAREFASWFDEYLLKRAITFESFLKQYRTETNKLTRT